MLYFLTILNSKSCRSQPALPCIFPILQLHAEAFICLWWKLQTVSQLGSFQRIGKVEGGGREPAAPSALPPSLKGDPLLPKGGPLPRRRPPKGELREAPWKRAHTAFYNLRTRCVHVCCLILAGSRQRAFHLCIYNINQRWKTCLVPNVRPAFRLN